MYGPSHCEAMKLEWKARGGGGGGEGRQPPEKAASLGQSLLPQEFRIRGRQCSEYHHAGRGGKTWLPEPAVRNKQNLGSRDGQLGGVSLESRQSIGKLACSVSFLVFSSLSAVFLIGRDSPECLW